MKPKYKAGDLLYIGVNTYMFIVGVEKEYVENGLQFYRLYNLKNPENEILKECNVIDEIVEMAKK